MCKRVIALFLGSVILFSCISFSYADYSSDNTGANYWDWLMSASNQVSTGTFIEGFVKVATGFLSGKVCSYSPDSYHHSDTKGSFGHSSGGTDDNGRFTWLTCKYCNEQFKFYISGGFNSGGSGFGKSDLQQSYEAQVEELPAPGFNSDGSLLWSPKLGYLNAHY